MAMFTKRLGSTMGAAFALSVLPLALASKPAAALTELTPPLITGHPNLVAVPEHSSAIGLIAVGAVGGVMLLKRKH